MRINTAIITCRVILLFCVSCTQTSQAQIANGEEYISIDYLSEARDNPVARLSQQLEDGSVTLQWTDKRGYFDDFLKHLGIDPSSQTLIFSPTSLQYSLISAATPRAIYFSDDTYIGWVKNSKIVEVTTMDAKLGLVFYVFNNERQPAHFIDRINQRCLVCHDSNGTMGGGVPLLLARSSIYSIEGENLERVTGEGNISDSTPLEDRWGGWYVSGEQGRLRHLGNIRLPLDAQADDFAEYQSASMATLSDAGFFNTDAYLRDTSDILALLILEHQLTVQNQLIYVKFKAPVVLERIGHPEAAAALSWQALPERAQRSLTRMMERLIATLLLTDAAAFPDHIASTSGFDQWFLAQGPRDNRGRSLRDLDLQSRLFTYPLSYLIYSADFNSLPAYALDYIYSRLAAILQNQNDDDSEAFEHISRRQKQDLLAILRDTKPEILPYLQ